VRIGFDAKWFFTGNPSGKVIVTNILKHMIQQNPQHEFYVFLKKSEKNMLFPYRFPNVKTVYVGGKLNLLSNILFIPLHSIRLRLDVCVFQYNSPIFSPFLRIVYIYDIIYKSNPEYFTIWEKIYFFPIKCLARRAHKIFTISNSEKKRIAKFKFAKYEAIEVIHLGVDERFCPRISIEEDTIKEMKEKYKLPEEYILYVGRLNERKNISNLLRAFSLIHNKGMSLVLGGTNDWKMFNLIKMIDDLKIKDRVIITGYIENDHLPAIYSMAKIFCYVSLDEGFGLPPLEAMASGVPVIVANAGSLPEVCEKAGSYVDPHKPEDIAKAIDNLFENHSLYLQKRMAGIQRAKMFSWEQSARTMMSCIVDTVEDNQHDSRVSTPA
jgi:glycosyltransferase involved in cell wall biosynthesis